MNDELKVYTEIMFNETMKKFTYRYAATTTTEEILRLSKRFEV